MLTAARLAPDMFPLARQVQLASDHAKGCPARLAGVPVPSFEDTEKTFPELKARIHKTLDFIGGLKPEQIDGSEGRDISLKAGPRELSFKGQDYLVLFALPNFYFHAATAYDILRHNGVPSANSTSWAPFNAFRPPAKSGILDFAGESHVDHRFVASASLGARVFDCGSSSVG